MKSIMKSIIRLFVVKIFICSFSDRDIFNEKPSREEIVAATQVCFHIVGWLDIYFIGNISKLY